MLISPPHTVDIEHDNTPYYIIEIMWFTVETFFVLDINAFDNSFNNEL